MQEIYDNMQDNYVSIHDNYVDRQVTNFFWENMILYGYENLLLIHTRGGIRKSAFMIKGNNLNARNRQRVILRRDNR